MATFNFEVQTPTAPMPLELSSGKSLLFVGANGSGKTRLAVAIEGQLASSAHRISAHRALILNVDVEKISAKRALSALMTGYTEDNNIHNRTGSRWSNREAVGLLNDFDKVMQYLFADQTNIAVKAINEMNAGTFQNVNETLFQKLKKVWEDLLPNRVLNLTGDNITVNATGITQPYNASEMSDGERGIFYVIGQALAVPIDTVIIIDEPELHIHKALLSKLWDQIEALRPDCAFVYISHDLDFVASRTGEKIVIKKYLGGNIWELEKVPEDTGFSEQLTTEILGSRKPILFVEGTGTSLDIAIYRNVYPNWTVISSGSCGQVIHSVQTMRQHPTLAHVTCAGIVDADDQSAGDIVYMHGLGVEVLPVAEIENLIMMPVVAEEMARHEGHLDATLTAKLEEIKTAIFQSVQQGDNIEKNVIAYCKRQIDRMLKKIDLSAAADTATLIALYTAETGALQIQQLADARRNAINQAIAVRDLPALLKLYDNKGLLAVFANAVKGTNRKSLESWLTRNLRNQKIPPITQAFQALLPQIIAQ